MNRDDGGPAFPVTDGGLSLAEGMTLRDQFAAAALTGMLVQGFIPSSVGPVAWNYAKAAYAMADQMLKERNA